MIQPKKLFIFLYSIVHVAIFNASNNNTNRNENIVTRLQACIANLHTQEEELQITITRLREENAELKKNLYDAVCLRSECHRLANENAWFHERVQTVTVEHNNMQTALQALTRERDNLRQQVFQQNQVIGNQYKTIFELRK